MKSVIIFSFLICVTIAAAMTEEQKKLSEQLLEICTKEVGVAKEKVLKVRDGNFENVDEKIHCFVECIYKKLGFMDAKGVFQDEYTLSVVTLGGIDSAKASKSIKKCKGESGAGKCETAFKIFECMFNDYGPII